MAPIGKTRLVTESDEGVNFTAEEALTFAQWLAARHLADGEWLEWEDLPMLGEHAFERLVDAAKAVAKDLSGRAAAAERRYDIDAAYLHGRATDG